MRTTALAVALVSLLFAAACSTQGGQGGDTNPYASGESATSPDALQNPRSGGGGGASSASDPMNPM